MIFIRRALLSDNKGKLWDTAQHRSTLRPVETTITNFLEQSFHPFYNTLASYWLSHNKTKMVNETLIKDGSATASKDLIPGEVFLSLPLIVEGPGCMKNPVCLGCLNPVSIVKTRETRFWQHFPFLPFQSSISELSQCPKCSWPICSTNCSKISNHSQVWGNKNIVFNQIFIEWISLFPEQTFEKDRKFYLQNIFSLIFFEEY